MLIMLLGTILIVPKSIFSALKSLTLIPFNYLKLKENEKDFGFTNNTIIVSGAVCRCTN
jgi:hypothetical protein